MRTLVDSQARISGSVLKKCMKGDKKIIEKLFIYMTARVPNEPLPSGMVHRQLRELLQARTQACGGRASKLEFDALGVDWSLCGGHTSSNT